MIITNNAFVNRPFNLIINITNLEAWPVKPFNQELRLNVNKGNQIRFIRSFKGVFPNPHLEQLINKLQNLMKPTLAPQIQGSSNECKISNNFDVLRHLHSCRHGNYRFESPKSWYWAPNLSLQLKQKHHWCWHPPQNAAPPSQSTTKTAVRND